jgi:hypothetical protein
MNIYRTWFIGIGLSMVVALCPAACGDGDGSVLFCTGGPGGSGSASSTVASSVSGTGTTGSSSSSVPDSGTGSCDYQDNECKFGSPNIPGSGSKCIECAKVGTCKTLLSTCIGMDCPLYRDCWLNCNFNQLCIANCGTGNTPGALQWRSIAQCLYCQECPHDCASVGALCPFL